MVLVLKQKKWTESEGFPTSAHKVNAGFLFLWDLSSLPDCTRPKCRENHVICFFWCRDFNDSHAKPHIGVKQLLISPTELRWKKKPSCLCRLQHFPWAERTTIKKSCEIILMMMIDEQNDSVFMKRYRNQRNIQETSNAGLLHCSKDGKTHGDKRDKLLIELLTR